MSLVRIKFNKHECVYVSKNKNLCVLKNTSENLNETI